MRGGPRHSSEPICFILTFENAPLGSDYIRSRCIDACCRGDPLEATNKLITAESSKAKISSGVNKSHSRQRTPPRPRRGHYSQICRRHCPPIPIPDVHREAPSSPAPLECGRGPSREDVTHTVFTKGRSVARPTFPCCRGNCSTAHGPPSRPRRSTCPSTSTSC